MEEEAQLTSHIAALKALFGFLIDKKQKFSDLNGYISTMSFFDDDELVQSALKNGAKGYLIKNHTPEHLKQMIKSVYYGTGVMEEAIYVDLCREKETILCFYFCYICSVE